MTYDIIGQNYDIIVSTMISGAPRFQMSLSLSLSLFCWDAGAFISRASTQARTGRLSGAHFEITEKNGREREKTDQLRKKTEENGKKQKRTGKNGPVTGKKEREVRELEKNDHFLLEI